MNKITNGIVGIIVCSLLVFGVFTPFVFNISEDQMTKTFTNTGSASSMYTNDDAPDLDITYDVTTYSVSGMNLSEGSTRAIIITDMFALTFWLDSVGFNFQYVLDGDTYARSFNQSNASDTTAINVTTSGNSIKVEFVDSTQGSFEYEYEYINLTDKDGDYRYREVFAGTTSNYYVNSINDVFMFNYLGGGNLATITNGVALYNGDSTTLVNNSPTADGVWDVYSLIFGTGNNVGVENGGTVYSGGFIIVPESVIGHSGSNGIIHTILGTLVILVVISLLVASAFMVRYRN